MDRKVFRLLGFMATVVTSINARNIDVPRYGVNKREAKVAFDDKLHHELKRSYPQSTHAQLTVLKQELERVLEPPNFSASIVPRWPTPAAAPVNNNALKTLPTLERKTLTDLYRSMGGPDWHLKDGWMSASNPCGDDGTTNKASWFGVDCTTFEISSKGGFTLHVTRLLLPHNNLVGKLPALRNLQHLLHLDFSGERSPEVSNDYVNSVGGTLDALCGLSNLSTVLLTGNNLTGSIPDCIQSLTNAMVLYLDFNNIHGTTPDELCHLHNQKELHLRGNHLHGTVPVCFGEDLTALRMLDYSNIHRDHSFGNQSLSGTIPASLCDLELLEILKFQATQGLHGTLPDCLGTKQPKLKKLALEMNQFEGPIPENICQANALEGLYLDENVLTGTLPGCLGSLSQLTFLELSDNRFRGPVSRDLCQASALEHLILSKNALTGTIPSCLGSLR